MQAAGAGLMVPASLSLLLASVPPAGRGQGHRHLVGAGRPRRRARPGDRRQPGAAQLALGVLDQPAGRPGRDRCWPPGWSRRARTTGPAAARTWPAPALLAAAVGLVALALVKAPGVGLGLGQLPRACWPPRSPAARRMVLRSRRAPLAGDRTRPAAVPDVQRRIRRVDPLLRRLRRVRAELGRVPDRRVALLGGAGRPRDRPRAR